MRSVYLGGSGAALALALIFVPGSGLRPTAGSAPAAASGIDVSGVIEKAGFTTCDDILHGYGGGYFPPVLGSRSRPAGKVPDLTLQAGMTVVVQPNVITKDQRAGVQVGELVHITEHGFERLHKAPRALFRVG